MSDHYYEVHITIEPPNRIWWNLVVQDVMDQWHLRLADFTDSDDGGPETVLTGRRDRRDLAFGLVRDVVPYLQRHDYKVLRYKVELAVMDSKIEDTMGLLGE